ncbi:unnamed protein product [Didymodactylos carnosus]|uniref:ADP ribosyltransferase domain-containing protein n=1 Tax=Didymodactylos carnosus TaxID=1234261 RepID=A0A816CPW9_9BILA|nr:unnamed protein product [Didymodactylos carnosus]CAF4520209.1 unnamed protein product [Didymodactylos carnosus]
MTAQQAAKEEMIAKLKEYYHDNKPQLKQVEEFDQAYSSEDVIRWYVRPFIFRPITQALCTENAGQIHAYRFLINDLRLMILQEYEQIKGSVEHLTVYRGGQFSNDEFEQMKKNIGNTLTKNEFLSTTRTREIALMFANSYDPTSDRKSVLFEITFGANSSAVFADISRRGDYPDESEILFDLGTTFEIQSIDLEEASNLWIIKLKAN